MNLRDTTVMLLGGSGLVGHAVARRMLAAGPKRLVLVALQEPEVRAAAQALEPYRGRVTVDVEWGNVFLPAAVARLDRSAMLANPAHRALLIEDQLGDFTEQVLERSLLLQLFQRYRPDAVVDSINTATAFAYQDIFKALAPCWPRPGIGPSTAPWWSSTCSRSPCPSSSATSRSLRRHCGARKPRRM